MVPPLTTEEVNRRLAPRGLKLVGTWQGVSHRNQFACSCGHTWSTHGHKVLGGSGCQKCSVKIRAQHRSLTKAEVNIQLTPRGISILEDWSSTKRYYTFKCSQGHSWNAVGYSVLHQGSGCPVCYIANRISSTTEAVNEALSSKGYSLLGTWQGVDRWHQFQCLKNHNWTSRGDAVLSGISGCPECNGRGYERLTTQDVNERLANRGLTLIGEWMGSQRANRFRCSLGHEWETTGKVLLNVHRLTSCPECARLRRKKA